jgi:flagellar biosynthesis/type III secretory pathway protein FliH
MKKTFSKSELEAKGLAFAKLHGCTKVHVTTDGQVFLEGKESFAKLHAKNWKLSVETFEYDNAEVFDKPAPAAKTAAPKKPALAADIIAAIEAAETVEEVEAAMPEGEKRATVVKAYDAKKAEFEAAAAEGSKAGTEEGTAEGSEEVKNATPAPTEEEAAKEAAADKIVEEGKK